MSLVVFTALCGILLAPSEMMHPFFMFLTILTIAVGSGASGAMNMWYERELDKKMQRTQHRPVAVGTILPENAFVFAMILATCSVVLLGLAVHWFAASLLLAAILYYVVIYTIWLKPRTPQNIVIGGAAGAFPPVIGWVAVTGEIALVPVIMFLLIFLWTPPHFWALTLNRGIYDDYKRAAIPMMPLVKGEKATKWQMLIYSIVLIPLSLTLTYPLGFLGWIYGFGALLLGAEFLRRHIILMRDDDNKTALSLFRYSILYLFALFLLMVCDKFFG